MWLPNATRVNLGGGVAGGPYDDTRNPKVCWHMTQGTTLGGARAAFAAYPPHLGYDPETRQLEQYVPLDRHSYAFFNGEADDEYVIQIEVVGFSENAHFMPDWQVQNIVDDLVNPLEEHVGVPPVVIWHGFHGEGEGIVLATPSSPIRISLGQLREFAGHLGHQHIPGDGHWDPGRFRIDEVLRRSQAPEDDMYSDGDRLLAQSTAARVEGLAKTIGEAQNGPDEGETLQGPIDINETKWRVHDLLQLKPTGDRDRVVGEEYPLVTLLTSMAEAVAQIKADVAELKEAHQDPDTTP